MQPITLRNGRVPGVTRAHIDARLGTVPGWPLGVPPCVTVSLRRRLRPGGEVYLPSGLVCAKSTSASSLFHLPPTRSAMSECSYPSFLVSFFSFRSLPFFCVTHFSLQCALTCTPFFLFLLPLLFFFISIHLLFFSSSPFCASPPLSRHTPISPPHAPPYHDPELWLNFGSRKASRRGSGYARGASSPRPVFLRAVVPRGCITPLPSCARRRYGVEPRGLPALRTANSCDLAGLNDGQLT